TVRPTSCLLMEAKMQITFQLADIVSIGPALFLFLASLMPLTIKTIRGVEPPPILAAGYICLGAIAAVTMAAVFHGQSSGTPFFAFSQALVIDGISNFSAILIAVLTGVAAIMAM